MQQLNIPLTDVHASVRQVQTAALPCHFDELRMNHVPVLRLLPKHCPHVGEPLHHGLVVLYVHGGLCICNTMGLN